MKGPAGDLRGHFALDPRHVWLNASHQGPIPRTAVAAAHEAVRWKAEPHELAGLEPFLATAEALRSALARLVAASPEEIVLSNGASHGLNVLANGLRLAAGDEVLLLAGAFPPTNLPFVRLRARGVRVRVLECPHGVLTPERLAAELSPRTRVLALAWVDSFSGHRNDLVALGEICRERGVRFLVNGSQGVGARPLAVGDAPIDALVSCGYKWLCGPYGTGFLWVRPALLEELDCPQANWLAGVTDLDTAGSLSEPVTTGVRAFDRFDTADFFNTLPWLAALELFDELGLDRIRRHDEHLVEELVSLVDRAGFELVSPRAAEARSTLVVFSHPDPGANAGLARRLERERIHVSLRGGGVRVSPHLYNTTDEIERLGKALLASSVQARALARG